MPAIRLLAVAAPALVALVAQGCTRRPAPAGGATVESQMVSRSGREDSIEVALTFDDLPSNGPLVPGETRRSIIDKILATLRTHGISPVTGFVNGRSVEEHPDEVAALKDWLAAGIGSAITPIHTAT